MDSEGQLLARAITALDQDGFDEHLIRWMTSSVPHDNIALIAYFQDRRPEIIFARSTTPEVHADLDKGYLEGSYLLDPFHSLHVSAAEPALYRLSDVAPDHFSRNQYFIEYYAKTTMVDEIAFVAHPSTGVSLQLCLGRDRASNRRFTQKQLKQAKEIHPIVSAMLNRQWAELATTGTYDEKESVHGLAAKSEERLGITLTDRQAEVIFMILKGHSSQSISLELDIAYQTVKVFRRQIYKKCGISSQAELFSMYVPLLG